MSKKIVEDLINSSLEALKKNNDSLGEIPAFQIEMTKDKRFGDFACNIAFILAKSMQRKPRDIAEMIVKNLTASAYIKNVEVAGAGFINFYLSDLALFKVVQDILEQKEAFGRTNIGQGQKMIVEFVSANPTGPLHVGHGRHAAYGAVVSDLLETIGYSVHREYYVNDAGRQMDILAASTWLRYLELCGEEIKIPANAYRGEYVIDIAKELKSKEKNHFFVEAKKVFDALPQDEPDGGDKEIYIDAIVKRTRELLGEERFRTVFDLALHSILTDIHDDLAEFGVFYQKWFSERAFVQTDVVDKNIQELQKKNLVYERDGALWFRSTDFNDEKDRVMVRSNGQRTYFANDFAYHINKFERGFDAAIDIFGADHHGYIPRMKAGLLARGVMPQKLDYLLLQFVTLYRGGEQVQMSTRSGSFVTLRELRAEVGNDVARFFYVMRKCEQHVDFDLDLAKSQTNENPVYYIQYAYARIASVFKQLKEKNLSFDEVRGIEHLPLLIEKEENQLMTKLSHYPQVIVNAAKLHEPHLLTNYLRELATDFHAYYNAHSFLVSDTKMRHARLSLVMATRQVLANALKLIGVSTPESM